jgi:hypothetical protein
MAINASGDVPPRIVPRPGGQSEPYLPHLHLARMLFKLGDCEGAEEELAFSLAHEVPPAAERTDVEKQRSPCPMPSRPI